MADNTDKEFIENLSGSLQELKDNHISILLSLPQKYLRLIEPNAQLQSNNIFLDFNAETAEEINRYGDALKSKVVSSVENSKTLLLENLNLKVKIEETVASFVEPRLYIKRFTILKGAMKSYLAKMGVEFDKNKYDVEHFEAIAATAAEEKCQAISNLISEELALLVLKSSADPAAKAEGQHSKKRVIFFGFGLLIVIAVALYFR